jgi:Mor family transcriptional regulator
MNKWLNDIQVDDLPEKYRQMAELIGVDNVLKLAESYQGEQLYFSSLSKLITKKKKEYIKAKFTGNNHKDLSKETGFAVRFIYRILGRKERVMDYRQGRLF